MISSSQRPLPDNTRHSQQTNIHTPGGIRTQVLSRRAASGRSPAEILGWNPTGGMDICLLWVSVLSGRGLCDELITRPEESYRLCCVVVCDLETSRMDAPYIYDISSLKVNNLTLILLTWRKWWALNNASIEQMGFNSGFKGLMWENIKTSISVSMDEAWYYFIVKIFNNFLQKTVKNY